MRFSTLCFCKCLIVNKKNVGSPPKYNLYYSARYGRISQVTYREKPEWNRTTLLDVFSSAYFVSAGRKIPEIDHKNPHGNHRVTNDLTLYKIKGFGSDTLPNRFRLVDVAWQRVTEERKHCTQRLRAVHIEGKRTRKAKIDRKNQRKWSKKKSPNIK